MRLSESPPPSRSKRVTTGFILIIAIARFASGWVFLPTTCFCRRWALLTIPALVGGRCLRTGVFRGDEITYVSLGDGTTSEGEFWEAMNTASNLKLPLMFVVEDNEYAISVPVEVQTAGGSISRLVTGFPDFHFEEVDGTDPVASYAAFMRSVQHCRAGRGPAFIHAHVIRPYSHSLSDDERLYRPV